MYYTILFQIIALLIEGRRSTNHRRRPNTSSYSKVETDDGSTVFWWNLLPLVISIAKTKLVVDSQCCDVEWLLIEEFPITIIVECIMGYILIS